MLQRTSSQNASGYQSIPLDAEGRWYSATDLLRDKQPEELNIQDATGAVVLAVRRGFWNGNLYREEAEIFLWGTEAQLAAAQEKFKLQTSIDALLDRPEIYWG
jgi:hypothetical protein